MRNAWLAACLLVLPALVPASQVLDDFGRGAPVNSKGGAWTTYTDGHSTLALLPGQTPGYANAPYCLHLDFQLKDGAPYPFVGALTFLNAADASADLSSWKGIRFWCRGTSDWRVFVATQATSDAKNHFAALFHPQDHWSLVEVPFDTLAQLWGPTGAWDPEHALSVGFAPQGLAPAAGWMELGKVEFYAADEGLAPAYVPFTSPRPKADQVGYLSNDTKWFTVVTSTASPGAPFAVVDDRGDTALSGTVGARVYDDTASSGEWVVRGDFSALRRAGVYRVWVQGQASQPFAVGPDVFDRLWKDALRTFSLIRCGVAVDDPVTGIRHAACHLVRATDTDPSLARDFSGGWHNAGDFGRWTHEEAFAVSHFLWLAEWRPDLAAHPPSGDPGLLKEARWGLDWLFKMLNPDGSVLHKVDSEPDFAAHKRPDEDPTTSLARYARKYSTIDAAVFSAVMAQASRVFRAEDPGYASRCAAASAKAWAWVQAHPNLGQEDPYYADPAVWQKVLWAEAERYRLTRDPALAADLAQRMRSTTLSYEVWNDPQLLGYFTAAFDPSTDAPAAALRAQARAKIVAYADQLESLQDASGYCVWLPPSRYYWGSISEVIGAGNVFCAANAVTGADRYRQDALRTLDNILGVNALDHSHAALYGTRSNQKPWNWAYLSEGKVMPGWLSEGPNRYPSGADPNLIGLIKKGTPPAKCFLDDGTSWATDEGTTDIESAFVLLAGYFHSPEGGARPGSGPP